MTLNRSEWMKRLKCEHWSISNLTLPRTPFKNMPDIPYCRENVENTFLSSFLQFTDWDILVETSNPTTRLFLRAETRLRVVIHMLEGICTTAFPLLRRSIFEIQGDVPSFLCFFAGWRWSKKKANNNSEEDSTIKLVQISDIRKKSQLFNKLLICPAQVLALPTKWPSQRTWKFSFRANGNGLYNQSIPKQQ